MAGKSEQKPLKDLSFNVEATHDEKALVSKSSDVPIHVRVKVHNRNDPKIGNNYWLSLPDSKSKILKHSASDQTILSFKLLMQPELDKNTTRRPRKSFINRLLPGVCLGIPNSDDEGPYMPGVPCIDDSNVIIKPGTTQTGKTQRHNNKFKPGGCLDPPFGEERYAYAPTNKGSLSEEHNNKILNKGDILIQQDTQFPDQISSKSSGLITYPDSTPIRKIDKNTTTTMSNITDQKRKPSQYSESAEMFFKPAKPKDTEESPVDPIKGLIPNVLGAKYNENDDEWTAITNKPLPTQYGYDADREPLEERFEKIILDPGKAATTGFKTMHDEAAVLTKLDTPDQLDIVTPTDQSTYAGNKAFESLNELDGNQNTDIFQPTQETLVPTDSFHKDDNNEEFIENITPDELTTGKYLMSDSEIINEDHKRSNWQPNMVTGIIGAIGGVLAETHDSRQVTNDNNEFDTDSNKNEEYITKRKPDIKAENDKDTTIIGKVIQKPSKKVVSNVTSYLRSGDNKDGMDYISSSTNLPNSFDIRNESENIDRLTHMEGQNKNENDGLKQIKSLSHKSDEFVAAISLHSAKSKGQLENPLHLKEQDGENLVEKLKNSGISLTSRLDSGSKKQLESTEKHLLDGRHENFVSMNNIGEHVEKINKYLSEKQDDQFANKLIEDKVRVIPPLQESIGSDEPVTNAKIYSTGREDDHFADNFMKDKIKVTQSRPESTCSKEEQDKTKIFSSEKEDDHFAANLIKDKIKVTESRQDSTGSKEKQDKTIIFSKEKEDDHFADNFMEDKIKVKQSRQDSTGSKEEQDKTKIFSSENIYDNYPVIFPEEKIKITLSQQESKDGKDQTADEKIYSSKKLDDYFADKFKGDEVEITQSRQEPVEEKSTGKICSINKEVDQFTVTPIDDKVSKGYKEEMEDDHLAASFLPDMVKVTQSRQESTGSKVEEAGTKIYSSEKEDDHFADTLKDKVGVTQSRQESISRIEEETQARIYSSEKTIDHLDDIFIDDKDTATQSLQESTGSKEYKEKYQLGEEKVKYFPDNLKEDVVRITTSSDLSNRNIIDEDSSLLKSKGLSSKKELHTTITKPVSTSLDDDVIRDSTSFASDVAKTAKPIHISTSDVHISTNIEEEFVSSSFGTSNDLSHIPITEHEVDTNSEHRRLANNLPIINERFSEIDTSSDDKYINMKKEISSSDKTGHSNTRTGNISLKSSENKIHKGAVSHGDKIDNRGQELQVPETKKGAQDYTSVRRIASSSIASSDLTNSQTSIKRQHHQIYKYRFDTPRTTNRREQNDVKMDIAFKTYIDKNKQMVIRTLDPRTIDANRSDNITKKKITSLSEDVEIPLNSNNKLLMRLKASPSEITSKGQRDKTAPKLNRALRSSSMNDFSSEDNETRNLTAINRYLGVIYEEQLVPLQKTINNLKQELQSLTLQQSMLTQKMLMREKAKVMRISSRNRKCGCYHN